MHRPLPWRKSPPRPAVGCGCSSIFIARANTQRSWSNGIFGNREWDKRNYRRPLQLDLRNTIDVALHPRWLFDVMVPHGMPRFKNLGDLLPPGQDSARGAASALARELDPSLNWDDIQWLRQQWSGKLIVKGILTVEDALLAAECGVDGIVLTNHGGRQLDGAISAMEILPDVAATVGDRLTVLIDGGFRRGSDIVKARLLGAHAAAFLKHGRATHSPAPVNHTTCDRLE